MHPMIRSAPKAFRIAAINAPPVSDVAALFQASVEGIVRQNPLQAFRSKRTQAAGKNRSKLGPYLLEYKVSSHVRLSTSTRWHTVDRTQVRSIAGLCRETGDAAVLTRAQPAPLCMPHLCTMRSGHAMVPMPRLVVLIR
jgi:hypothetical protein